MVAFGGSDSSGRGAGGGVTGLGAGGGVTLVIGATLAGGGTTFQVAPLTHPSAWAAVNEELKADPGKLAAGRVLELQRRLLGALDSTPRTADELARLADGDPVTCFVVLRHLAANGRVTLHPGAQATMARFSKRGS